MANPLISVIIPVYNGEATLAETLHSVLNQTVDALEILIINDGSTDGTPEVIQSFQDPRIRVHHDTNAGLSTARNRGIALARGKYLAFMDADDLWTPDKLALQLDALQRHPEAGVAYSWTLFFNDDGIWLGPQPNAQGMIYTTLLRGNLLASGSNPLIRKEAIADTGLFDTRLTSYEDWDYYLRLARRWSYVVVPRHQILYRLGAGSMSSRFNIMEQNALAVLGKTLPDASMPLSQAMAGLYLSLADITLSRGTTRQDACIALGFLLKASLFSPRDAWSTHAHAMQKHLVKAALSLVLPHSIFQSLRRHRHGRRPDASRFSSCSSDSRRMPYEAPLCFCCHPGV